MPAKNMTEYGQVIISEKVIATIAGAAAMESYGIVGMASKNAKEGFMGLLKWDNISKGVNVLTEEDGVIIDLYVILEYGVGISVVAENIVERVKFSVEKYTGITVKKINVMIQGVRVDK